MAIGASRSQVAAQFLAESVVLSAFGGLLGIALAHALGPVLPTVLTGITERFNTLGLAVPTAVDLVPDWRVFAFSACVALSAGVAFGLVAAVRGSRVDIAHVMKGGAVTPSEGRGLGRFNGLIIGQVALSTILLVGAGLFVRTFIELVSTLVGYDPEGVIFVTVVPGNRQTNMVRQVLDGLNRVPGVEAAAVSQWPLFNDATGKLPICGEGDVEPRPVDVEAASESFFETWGIPVVRGETFAGGLAHVAIANETFVKNVFGGSDPIGRTVREGDCSGNTRTIAGVVQDHTDSQRKEITPMLYIPFNTQVPVLPTTFAVRAPGQTESVGVALRGLVGDLGLDVDSDIQTGVGYRNRTLQRERVLAFLLSALGLLALVICSLGIYGTVAYALNRRIREVGIRLALGETRGGVMRSVVQRTLVPIATGIVVGIVAALAAGRAIESLLFGVGARDPLTLLATGALLVLVGAFSSFVPALRVLKVSPLRALRHE